ncbi:MULTISPECIES: NAD-dependent epimerase/dehydratase family protein [Pectobacterium]|uniref:NAD(P)-dependent oxidoreductase n=1 Tax=Pectobacterium aquaticum TaxID=2204145 RepID=A0AA93ANL5_9GAMM|nr:MULTISPECIES: NAD(P)-dependent oxidoreductase [Pectobacterium]MBE5202626.1 NAD(P)-dependent oxidoreductase [Pectobacterium quasiaquaticum]MBE5211090.1 NAD(P)-dependent oxidoreductase [Pectobacterium quasiaquaticum]MBE5222868.1 NAD(P)-dependent oxidoreductase [Pectobacterium quasiaquaticum]RRO22747.1 NAD(P)-dependent oxidoreductase [Pectobacterium aquaticum]
MIIAILGATSQISQDLVINFNNLYGASINLDLYARNVTSLNSFLEKKEISNYCTLHIDDFCKIDKKYDVVINFIGAGSPDKVKSLGDSILQITEKYDNLCLEYLKHHKSCKYIFFSSGAVYGDLFFSPPKEKVTPSIFNISDATDHDWYGLSKFISEVKHRAMAEFAIVDVRLFGYFSESQNINDEFFLSQLCRNLIKKEKFITNDVEIYRDYIGEKDLFDLVNSIITGENINTYVDVCSKKIISKSEILALVSERFELDIEVIECKRNLSNRRKYYFSNNNENYYNFKAKKTSADTIVDVMLKIVNRIK